MDHVRSQPDAGLRAMPYAKSDKARRIGLVLLAGIGLSGFIFGWLGGLIALLVAVPFMWRLEHHFFFNGRHPADASVDGEGSTDKR